MEVCEQRPANAATSMVLGDTNSDSRPLHFSLTAWGRCVFQRVSLYSKLTIVTLVSHHSLQWPPHPAKRKETCANKPRPIVYFSPPPPPSHPHSSHTEVGVHVVRLTTTTHTPLPPHLSPSHPNYKEIRKKSTSPTQGLPSLGIPVPQLRVLAAQAGHDFEPVHHSILGSTVACRLLLEGHVHHLLHRNVIRHAGGKQP